MGHPVYRVDGGHHHLHSEPAVDTCAAKRGERTVGKVLRLAARAVPRPEPSRLSPRTNPLQCFPRDRRRDQPDRGVREAMTNVLEKPHEMSVADPTFDNKKEVKTMTA